MLASGTRLGPYEIQRAIDAGGMGEVYLATDTRLRRHVAVKIVRDGMSGDPVRRERFAREARSLSSLTHPNICQIYDVGNAEGIDFLVMEYLEGETIETRLMQGSLPLSEVLHIGSEIAAALDSAHRRHIIHRDVKPSNVMLTRSGPKLLDFGLAKDEAHIENAATLSLTAEGSAPGTVQYMAPEQLCGETDARSDIWSLGTMLYEMATGRPLWTGSGRAELSAAIMTTDADLSGVKNEALRHAIERCIVRDPENRWQSARDLAEELRWIGNRAPRRGREIRLRATLVAAISGLTLLAAGVAAWSWSREKQTRNVPRLSIAPPAGSILYGGSTPVLVSSPDGSQVIFRVLNDATAGITDQSGVLFLRSLDHFDARVLDQNGGWSPAYSPDGEWIAYRQGPKLMKIRHAGGSAYEIASIPGSSRGITWSPNGKLYFAKSYSGGITSVGNDGSDLRELTTPDKSADENSHRWPHALPDGRNLLITVRTGQLDSFDQASIALLSLETERWRTLFVGGSDARYVRSGHIVFIQNGTLMAIRFDLTTLSVRGSPVPILDGVKYDSATGAGQFAIAADAGTLVYLPGPVRSPSSGFLQLDRNGAVVAEWTVPKNVDSFRASSDSRLLAIQASAANDDIWTYDIDRETLTRITTRSGDEIYPGWMNDGRTVVFGGHGGLFSQPVDSSGEARQIVGAYATQPSTSPDGSLIAYVGVDAATGNDIWIVPSDHSASERALVQTQANETSPEFSRDGRWIAYVSNESGREETYLRAVNGGERIQVSSTGGMAPRWSADGSELFYRFGDEFFAVPVTFGPTAVVGRTRLLFRLTRVRNWDVLGEQFVILRTLYDDLDTGGIHVVPDFLEEITSRLP